MPWPYAVGLLYTQIVVDLRLIAIDALPNHVVDGHNLPRLSAFHHRVRDSDGTRSLLDADLRGPTLEDRAAEVGVFRGDDFAVDFREFEIIPA